MANFDPAYERTLEFEGKVLEDVTGDPGGETFYGVSRKNWPSWPGWDVIDQLKAQYSGGALKKALGEDSTLPGLVKGFYQKEFWNKLSLGDLASQKAAEEIFDTAVNVGTGEASRMVQRALNVFNKEGKLWPDLLVDGNMGPKTADTVNRCCKMGPEYAYQFFHLLNCLQAAFYVSISEKNPRLEKFFFGWMKQRVQA